MERIAAAEQKVVELESQAAASQVEPSPSEPDVDPKTLLIQMTAALERAVKVIGLLESRLKPGASLPDSLRPDSGSVAGESEI